MSEAIAKQSPLLSPSRRHLAKAALAGIGTLAIGATAAHAASSHIRSVSTDYRNADAQRLLNLINEYRAQNGLGPLRHSATVASVMDGEAARQFRAGAFSHGTEFIYNPKVRGYSFVREVIALSYNDDISQLLSFWKSSPAHKAAILAPQANTCGIGLCYGTGSGLPWRVLGNVGIYRYDGSGPGDIQSTVTGGGTIKAQSIDFELRGGIGARYYADGGAARYGVPTNNEQGGLLHGGYRQNFQKGDATTAIMWSPYTEAHPVYLQGGIGGTWINNGSENGLGYPIMAETGGLVNGGYYQRFQKGNLFTKVMWSPATGTQKVFENGAIGNTYAREGNERGLGYPTTSEYWDGIYVRQHFNSGKTISWNSTNGAVKVH